MVDGATGVGIVRIPEEKAALLPNKTYPFERDEGYYIGELSVFHHLHCLVGRRLDHKGRLGLTTVEQDTTRVLSRLLWDERGGKEAR